MHMSCCWLVCHFDYPKSHARSHGCENPTGQSHDIASEHLSSTGTGPCLYLVRSQNVALQEECMQASNLTPCTLTNTPTSWLPAARQLKIAQWVYLLLRQVLGVHADSEASLATCGLPCKALEHWLLPSGPFTGPQGSTFRANVTWIRRGMPFSMCIAPKRLITSA